RCSSKNRGDGKVFFKRRYTPIVHFQLRRSFFVRRSLGVEISNSHDLIESLRAHSARIHPERAADRARNSLHPLQSANTHGLSGISNLLELRANTDRDFVAVNFHLVKIAAARMNHHAANPTIPDEQVRATTDY